MKLGIESPEKKLERLLKVLLRTDPDLQRIIIAAFQEMIDQAEKEAQTQKPEPYKFKLYLN